MLNLIDGKMLSASLKQLFMDCSLSDHIMNVQSNGVNSK